MVLACARYFFINSSNRIKTTIGLGQYNAQKGQAFEEFMRGMLYDSLVREKPESVPLQLGMWLPLAQLMAGEVPRHLAQWVWGLRQMEACHQHQILGSSCDGPLIGGTFLQGALLAVPSILQPSPEVLHKYFSSFDFPPSMHAALLFGGYLSFYSIPQPLQLASLRSADDSPTSTLLSLARQCPALPHHVASALLHIVHKREGN